MLIISWNVKGLGYPQKRSHIHDFLKMYVIDIVLLQETQVAFPSNSFLRSIGNSSLMGLSYLNPWDIGWANYRLAWLCVWLL